MENRENVENREIGTLRQNGRQRGDRALAALPPILPAFPSQSSTGSQPKKDPPRGVRDGSVVGCVFEVRFQSLRVVVVFGVVRGGDVRDAIGQRQRIRHRLDGRS